MKLRAVHLLRKLETIERDLLELDTLQDRIRDDRIYADRLRSSLTDEAMRLKGLRTRILSQVIRNPPEMLLNPPSVSSLEELVPEGIRGPEIIIPGKAVGRAVPKANANDENQSPVDAIEPKGSKPAPPVSKRKKKNGDPAEKDAFEFRYE